MTGVCSFQPISGISFQGGHDEAGLDGGIDRRVSSGIRSRIDRSTPDQQREDGEKARGGALHRTAGRARVAHSMTGYVIPQPGTLEGGVSMRGTILVVDDDAA